MSKRIPADYPGKKSLTETEANNALRNGPELTWFEPWAVRGVHLSDATSFAYGYTHVYSTDGAFNYDFAAWPNKEGLALGLDALWHHHTRRGLVLDPTYPRCENCQGVVYFMADEPPHLKIVIEQDDEEDLSDEGEADQ